MAVLLELTGPFLVDNIPALVIGTAGEHPMDFQNQLHRQRFPRRQLFLERLAAQLLVLLLKQGARAAR